MDILSIAYLFCKIRFQHFIDCFRDDESGVSAIIATVLILVIVVALAAIFWDFIKDFFQGLLDKITGKSAPIGD